MPRRSLSAAALLAGSLLLPGVATTRQATPIAEPLAAGTLATSADTTWTDLAAMALAGDDLPTGFANVDERSFLEVRGVSTFSANGGTPAEDGASPEAARFEVGEARTALTALATPGAMAVTTPTGEGGDRGRLKSPGDEQRADKATYSVGTPLAPAAQPRVRRRGGSHGDGSGRDGRWAAC